MAKRLCFISTPDEKTIFKEECIEFEYFRGFSITQKQKSIASLHESIIKSNDKLKPLEISTKSPDLLGRKLSAFNLTYYDKYLKVGFPLENVFQSSKVFEYGGPYKDLLYFHPKNAKQDQRLKQSGKLTHFELNNELWELEPKSMFYDWIYINSLYNNKNLSEDILNYNTFTDIEFNHLKSINCQARSAAIFVSLCKRGIIEEVINNKELFEKIYT